MVLVIIHLGNFELLPHHLSIEYQWGFDCLRKTKFHFDATANDIIFIGKMMQLFAS